MSRRWLLCSLLCLGLLIVPLVRSQSVSSRYPRQRLIDGISEQAAGITATGKLKLTVDTPTVAQVAPGSVSSTYPRYRLIDGSTETAVRVSAAGRVYADLDIPNCTDTGGNHLNFTTATSALSCGTSGGGGTPGGNNTDVQFNDSGAFGGSDSFVYDKTNIRVGLSTSTPDVDIAFGGLAARTIRVKRNTTPGNGTAAGADLTVQAGGATSGETDVAGGTLNLASGIATGGNESLINLLTATPGGAGATDRTPTAKLQITSAGHLVSKGAKPTVAGCGASPTIAGTATDTAGKVTSNTTGVTTCTITFARTYDIAPACTVTNETTANLVRATSTTSAVALAGTMVSGDVLAYICIGF